MFAVFQKEMLEILYDYITISNVYYMYANQK